MTDDVSGACVCGLSDGTHTLECTAYPAEWWQSQFEKDHGIAPKYHTYSCIKCGAKDVVNSYVQYVADSMLARRMCFTCDFWVEFEIKNLPKHSTMTIIDGRVLSPGNRRSGEFRGMGGRRFDIEYIGASKYAGSKITTFDLWSGSEIPEDLRAKFPDTARFEDCATWSVCDVKGFNSVTDYHKPKYPSPKILGIGVK